jgi:uncharacterized DUF497 family protein
LYIRIGAPTIFEWDEAKRAANLAKHGIDFDAVRSFDWSTAVHNLDTRAISVHASTDGERRWRVSGLIAGRLHQLVYTERAGRIRIISIRKANVVEQTAYETKAHP